MDAIIEIVDHTDVTKVEDEVKTATRSSEELAESIDREVHILQYKLDHCRRLLQGSFSDTTGSHIILEKWNSSRLELKKRLFNLKFIAKHLLQHMNDSNLNAVMVILIISSSYLTNPYPISYVKCIITCMTWINKLKSSIIL